ncbi:hypothetical protein [Acidipropionibacterium virtanenii]|uniref:Uncharacterized protein n=1 Tax=Acidipropionibacterium virtanenii TaxID=2057246 RepID=A0A344UR62_9ACTN|nr:hypothetical protein [Acidipropionibacterium virtanenii]AXE37760.1 hypothetical protein JS278_00567 [Acidipropionibacterium virtanenii]
MERTRPRTLRAVLASAWTRALGLGLLLAICSLLSNLTTRAQIDGRSNAVLAIRLTVSNVFNSGTAWAGLAIAAGWCLRRPLRSAVAAVLSCELALAVHYSLGIAVGQMGSSIWWENKSWFIGAVILGAPLGMLGSMARRRDVPGLIARLLIPAGAILEPFVLRMLPLPDHLPWPYRLSSGICGILLLTFGLTAGYLVIQHWRRTRTREKA